MKRKHYRYDSIYNEKIASMRDILVPLHVFNSMVEYVEGTNAFAITYSLRYDQDRCSYDATREMFVMPYPYMIGVSKTQEMLEASNSLLTRSDISDANRVTVLQNIVHDKIGKRISPFMQNIIEKNTMDMIDSNPDIGCILHVSTGNLVFFHYSCVDDLEVFQIDSMVPSYLYVVTHKDAARVKQEMNGIRTANRQGPKYKHLYKFHYTATDTFNPSGEVMIATSTNEACIAKDNSLIIAQNIINRFKNHQKVIVTA